MHSFSYDPGTPIAVVRSFLGDTDKATAFCSDEEIQAAIDYQGSPEGAVYQLAMQLASSANRSAASKTVTSRAETKSLDDTRRPQHWLAIADRFRAFSKSSLPKAKTTTGHISTDGFSTNAIRPRIR